MSENNTPSVRTAIVTGAGQGIGRAIAIRLASDGLSVTLADLAVNQTNLETVRGEISQAGGRCRTAVVDVTKDVTVNRMVAEHVAEYGGIDVMVANAGIAVTAHFVDTTVEDIDRSMAVNVRGVFNCYKAASVEMIKQGRGGRLIAAGSVSAHRGGEWQCAYVASKFAVRGFNQTVALELAKYGITANLYSPGATRTQMYASIDDAVSKKEGVPPGSEMAKVESKIPLGRFAQPEDIAKVVSFLASQDSGYVTGQSIVADGGQFFV